MVWKGSRFKEESEQRHNIADMEDVPKEIYHCDSRWNYDQVMGEAHF